MTTGQRIKAARKKAGLTQKELGERLGITYQTLAQWENDLRNPKYDTLKRIAAALNVPIYDLMDDYSPIIHDLHNELLTLEELAAEMNVSKEKILSVLNLEIDDPEFQKKMNRIALKLSMRKENLLKLEEKAISKMGAENYHKFSAALDSALDASSEFQSDFLLKNLYTAFVQLNFNGQQEAVKRVEELTEIPRYQATPAPQSPPSPQEGKDTPPPEGAEGTGEGE